MSHVVHHAIVVTCYAERLARKGASKARKLGLDCSRARAAKINGYWSFCVFPDGSSEGRADSNEGDRLRSEFKTWLRAQEGRMEWVEVVYGADMNGCGEAPAIEAHQWDATASSPTASR